MLKFTYVHNRNTLVNKLIEGDDLFLQTGFALVKIIVTLVLLPLTFKDTHRKKEKTPALRKTTNMGVCAVGTLNQLFIRGS